MLLENDAALDYRERRLRELCPLRPPVPPRSPPTQKTRAMGDPVGLSFYSARRRIRSELDEDLLRLASAAHGRLPKQILRELLNAVATRGATARHVTDAIQLIDILAPLPAEEQLDIVALYPSVACSDVLREELLGVLGAASALPRPSRLQLLRYVTGPNPGTHAHPEHECFLRGFWATRAREARHLLAATTDPRVIHAYLVEPVRPFHILRSPADLDLVIAVFGDPRSSKSLSFGRYYALDERGHAEAVVVCPDPRVVSDWRGTAPLTDRPFECRSVILTRAEELEMLRWLEESHAVTPHERWRPAPLPFAIFCNARRLPELLEPTLQLFASIRGPLTFHRSRMRRGRVRRRRM